MDRYSLIEKRLRTFGIFGIISLLSYTAMVLFSPLAYPDYDWKSMAISELSADGSPSKVLANQLNSLFGPCAILSVMAICIEIINCPSKLMKFGIYSFTLMEWITQIGYNMFPWVTDGSVTHPQNIMHLIITVLVVILSLISLIVISLASKNFEQLKSLSIWSIVCLIAMLIGPIGTGLLPKSVFGIFERFSTFSVVIFNAILGIYLMKGKFLFDNETETKTTTIKKEKKTL
ncbi:hypothetical protein BCR32DRAFT_266419 [Anaeromyces robustus]|uniref:Uncharacterized protein n=1 Tax=Anaeromyces robustus TaxID=1754192 RepID=A0A1Y1XEZ1_9FUNG|nr:hypothetical protein BCR32DRAFT_266419 [Anaeromyces robustus]|eukprot:ORX84287.1 hypothetical protein BCR32DRAFT_266419 [Anaeromyces robustus]